MGIKRNTASIPPLPPHSNGAGDGFSEDEGDGGARLSTEEIKDVVCSTGLWVVVFGGVGRVGRKVMDGGFVRSNPSWVAGWLELPDKKDLLLRYRF